MKNFRDLFVCLTFIVIIFTQITSSMSPHERSAINHEPPQGLYGPSDHVLVLSNKTMSSSLYNQPIASFVEFYNSFCGACQRFSPTWKSLAKNVTKWRSFVQIAALDCATDENNDVCRQFEVMRYPTMRYFPPNYPPGAKQLGTNLDHLIIPQPDALLNELVGRLQNETNGGAKWPKFDKFKGDRWHDLTKEIHVQFIYVISDELPLTLPQQIVLDYAHYATIFVKIVDSTNLRLLGDINDFKLGVIDRANDKFTPLTIHNDSREAINVAIDSHLRSHNLFVTEATNVEIVTHADSSIDKIYYEKAREISPMPLFRADLEMAIKQSLGHEVTQKQVISGELLNALRNFVSVLSRYYNFDNKQSYKKLLNYLMEPSRTEVKGEEFEHFLASLNPPIIRETRFVGCFSMSNGKRRYPCSLWSLFHHLTVQHFDDENNEDPMEVLNAMYGYIKYFFGCTECSKHFQEMAKRNHIWNVTSKDQAVLWLWSSHNEVNKRLHGDLTEDENHPKIQFPAEDHCRVCRKPNNDWDKTEVLEFLRRHYSNEHVSTFGLSEVIANGKIYNARQIFTGNGGDDFHLHIGVLAYVVIIICLMIAAVRFYRRRGYKKKIYAHGGFGKV